MSLEKKVKELEHEIDMLRHKLQIAELQAEIERKKLKRYIEEHDPPPRPWKVETSNSQMYADTAGVRELTNRISQAMNKQRREK